MSIVQSLLGAFAGADTASVLNVLPVGVRHVARALGEGAEFARLVAPDPPPPAVAALYAHAEGEYDLVPQLLRAVETANPTPYPGAGAPPEALAAYGSAVLDRARQLRGALDAGGLRAALGQAGAPDEVFRVWLILIVATIEPETAATLRGVFK